MDCVIAYFFFLLFLNQFYFFFRDNLCLIYSNVDNYGEQKMKILLDR